MHKIFKYSPAGLGQKPVKLVCIYNPIRCDFKVFFIPFLMHFSCFSLPSFSSLSKYYSFTINYKETGKNFCYILFTYVKHGNQISIRGNFTTKECTFFNDFRKKCVQFSCIKKPEVHDYKPKIYNTECPRSLDPNHVTY